MGHVVIDTNVLVSAIVTEGGIAEKVVARALRRYEIAQTRDTMRELEEVLARPHIAAMISLRVARRGLARIRDATVFFRVEPALPHSRDPDDDVYLHLAIVSGAAAIVSGDRDLLVLKEFAGIPILSPSGFLRRERSIRRGRGGR